MKALNILKMIAIVFGIMHTKMSVGVEIKGFKSALFGSTAESVMQAIRSDLGIKQSAIKSSVDPASGMRVLEVKVSKLDPINTPAAVSYLFGYKCQCLTQININWQFPEQMNSDQRMEAMISVEALKNHFSEQSWAKGQSVIDRAIGQIKPGNSAPFVFFRGINERNSLVVLVGDPVMIKEDKNDASKYSADFDTLRSIQLIYQLNSAQPDVRKINLNGF